MKIKTMSTITETNPVAETLTKMYDLGLDHAIQLIEEKKNHYPTSHELHYHLSDLIEQLKELKQIQLKS